MGSPRSARGGSGRSPGSTWPTATPRTCAARGRGVGFGVPAQRTRGFGAQPRLDLADGHAAQGVALAARDASVPCTVMVIDTAPDTKLSAIERLGARIVTASYDECWRTVEQHQRDRLPGHFVHPFDDDLFISGNGTIGLEIIEQLADVDAIVAVVSGGNIDRATFARIITERDP